MDVRHLARKHPASDRQVPRARKEGAGVSALNPSDRICTSGVDVTHGAETPIVAVDVDVESKSSFIGRGLRREIKRRI
jgi:hypothetical protein